MIINSRYKFKKYAGDWRLGDWDIKILGLSAEAIAKAGYWASDYRRLTPDS